MSHYYHILKFWEKQSLQFKTPNYQNTLCKSTPKLLFSKNGFSNTPHKLHSCILNPWIWNKPKYTSIMVTFIKARCNKVWDQGMVNISINKIIQLIRVNGIRINAMVKANWQLKVTSISMMVSGLQIWGRATAWRLINSRVSILASGNKIDGKVKASLLQSKVIFILASSLKV